MDLARHRPERVNSPARVLLTGHRAQERRAKQGRSRRAAESGFADDRPWRSSGLVARLARLCSGRDPRVLHSLPMLDPDVKSFVLAELPASPARVLEVGAGNGELARALTSAGYVVVAIDPHSDAPAVRRVGLNEVLEPVASFDAAVAVVSLHHVEPLAESCRRLSALVRRGGTLVLDEFDVDLFDESAARWWLARRQCGEDEDRTPADVIAFLRHHCHSLSMMRAALEPWFVLRSPVRGPYLYRWNLPPGLRATEEDDIAAGRLTAIGTRLVGTRT